MALQQTINTSGDGIVYSPFGKIETGTQQVSFSAYCKVICVSGSKEMLTATVNFSNDDNQYSKDYSFTPSVADNSDNFIKQAYAHLKTLDEFAGATDV